LQNPETTAVAYSEPFSDVLSFTWVVSAEGVGSVVEGGRRTGETDGDRGQQEADEGDHSIHAGDETRSIARRATADTLTEEAMAVRRRRVVVLRCALYTAPTRTERLYTAARG